MHVSSPGSARSPWSSTWVTRPCSSYARSSDVRRHEPSAVSVRTVVAPARTRCAALVTPSNVEEAVCRDHGSCAVAVRILPPSPSCTTVSRSNPAYWSRSSRAPPSESITWTLLVPPAASRSPCMPR
ncbi:hypothetical protein ACFQQB_18670 [Nonomuraea rubra]|uniref:hypothetical protein n=1 Tax=Nonomuraea rubra TaxID=46180 RepID=UPI003609035E